MNVINFRAKLLAIESLQLPTDIIDTINSYLFYDKYKKIKQASCYLIDNAALQTPYSRYYCFHSEEHDVNNENKKMYWFHYDFDYQDYRRTRNKQHTICNQGFQIKCYICLRCGNYIKTKHDYHARISCICMFT
jgi:hypothetical protein